MATLAFAGILNVSPSRAFEFSNLTTTSLQTTSPFTTISFPAPTRSLGPFQLLPTESSVDLKLFKSEKNVKNEVNGDTSFPPSILHEMIAPADSPSASTSRTPVVTIATVMSWVSVAFTLVIIMLEIWPWILWRILLDETFRHSRRCEASSENALIVSMPAILA